MSIQTNTPVWLRPKLWISLAVVVLFSLWLGIPTFNKWRADRLVDGLCAKDGGIKVYETVVLPVSMFNKYGQPEITFMGQAVPEKKIARSGLFFSIKTRNIVGNHDSTAISSLAVWQSRIDIRRISDGKVLGETIQYSRRGGDAIGPWHPSSYGCPSNSSEWDLASRVITKQPNK